MEKWGLACKRLGKRKIQYKISIIEKEELLLNYKKSTNVKCIKILMNFYRK